MLVALVLALSGCKADPRCPEAGVHTVCDGPIALTCDDGRRRDELVCGDDETCADEAGCVACALDLPSTLTVPIDPEPTDGEAWRTLGWRALALDGAGTAVLELTGPFEAYSGDGALLNGAVTLPTTVFLRATAGPPGSLAVRLEGCASIQTLALFPRTDPGLSATLRAAGVPASYVDVFPTGGTIRVALDPVRHPDRVDQVGGLWIVPDRDREEWLEDPVLVDVLGAAGTLRMGPGRFAENVFEIWPGASAEPGTIGRYDIVVDYDQDGRLGPGDLIDGLDGPGFTVMPDLSEPGPSIVRIDEVAPSFWNTQRIYRPTDIATFDRPAPIVVISHGNGHEYTWYDYLGEHLASWGYVVVAHRNDTEPGVQAAATTTLTNTDGFVRNHVLLDPALEGRVDTHRIVWIGHSRGAEGILVAHQRLSTGAAGVQAITADDIVLLSSIAPTVFGSPTDANPGRVPFHMLTGSADGDVTGGVATTFPLPAPCALCQSWRLLQAGTGHEHVTYMHGAIHNDFNCCGPNDGFNVGAPKIGRYDAQRMTKALYVALLRYELEGEAAFGEYLRRSPEDLGFDAPTELPLVAQSRLARDPSLAHGVAIEDFQTHTTDPTVSSSGTEVRHSVQSYVEGTMDDRNLQFAHDPGDPWNGMTQSHDDDPAIAARGAVFEWTTNAMWEVDLPEALRDVSTRSHVSLRIAQATRHPLTVELDDSLAFAVALIDGAGTEVVLPTAAYGRVSAPYPRGALGAGTGWANEFNTVRLPIADFESGGLDLADVRTIRLRFGPAHGSPMGRVGLDDVVLEDL